MGIKFGKHNLEWSPRFLKIQWNQSSKSGFQIFKFKFNILLNNVLNRGRKKNLLGKRMQTFRIKLDTVLTTNKEQIIFSIKITEKLPW